MRILLPFLIWTHTLQNLVAGQGNLPRCAKTNSFSLLHLQTQMCLDNYNGGTGADNPVVIWGCGAGNVNQLWKATHVGKGYYAISRNVSNSCLEVIGSKTDTDSPCGATNCDPAAQNQLWQLVPLKNPAFQLKSKVGSNMCLTPIKSGTSQGTQVAISACQKAENQGWVLNAGKGPGANNGTGKAMADSKGKCALWSQPSVPKKRSNNAKNQG